MVWSVSTRFSSGSLDFSLESLPGSFASVSSLAALRGGALEDVSAARDGIANDARVKPMVSRVLLRTIPKRAGRDGQTQRKFESPGQRKSEGRNPNSK